jgi:hypothetical protein
MKAKKTSGKSKRSRKDLTPKKTSGVKGGAFEAAPLKRYKLTNAWPK